DNGKKYTPGSELNFGDKGKVDEYLGIPFAKPPIKERRFKAPEEAVEPTSLFKANYPAATCPQHLFKTNVTALDFWNPPNNISEDCLQLNMWVPKDKVNLPVLVNLCGGEYWRLSASNDIFNGSVLAAYSGAIVVNLNFRLGALGFARHNKSGINGNMGLLDQQMGLKWINKHISAYGGDPNKVTLMGEQTGASSAEAHLYSEESKNLFKRIALTSGTLENPWASRTNEQVEENTKQLANLLGCSRNNNKKRSSNINSTCMQ
uniref:COesterase domain-containing protein n=1 Tax=Parastrongyloides trichosuri TaxID=131310 RepID=A0A0N4Z6D4_PARTI